MAQATNYQGMIRQSLENLVHDAYEAPGKPFIWEGDVHSRMTAVADRLRSHDGWADWREIRAEVREAALLVCRRRRRPEWKEIRAAVETWNDRD